VGGLLVTKGLSFSTFRPVEEFAVPFAIEIAEVEINEHHRDFWISARIE
jgi:hypothetical protein